MTDPTPPIQTAIVGESPAFLATLEQVSRAAPLSKPVLVIGERGTGKELIAGRLHYLSKRWEEPFIKVNCAALTESILESELFGHEAGAFTGAVRQHVGRFERADGGTLFLDELATVPTRMQEKILRVIEYGEFERVGGSATIKVDVRLVGATNANLPALVRQGTFRADLLDRLAFDVINVPPLRARPEDILVLAEHFALNITSELGRSYFAGFAPDARALLLQHSWPGNVRELKNVVERSVYRWEDLDEPLHAVILNPFAAAHPLPSAESTADHDDSVPGLPTPSEPTGGIVLPCKLKERVAQFEVNALEEALEYGQFNQRRAAEALGLTYHQFRSYMKKHGLLEKYGRNARTAN